MVRILALLALWQAILIVGDPFHWQFHNDYIYIYIWNIGIDAVFRPESVTVTNCIIYVVGNFFSYFMRIIFFSTFWCGEI